MYTIYAYFNIDQIQAVLNAVVMLVGSGGVDGDYLDLIRVAGMIGLMIAVTAGMVKARGEEAGMYVVMMAIFYTTLFTPRVSVTIEEAGGGGGAPVTVDNVPLGLAFFASTTSKIGHWFTQKTETFFTLPDSNLKFGSHGLMGAARTLREASSAAVQDPITQQDMINFMRDCINPELVASAATMTSLMSSRNLWQDFSSLGLINPGRMVSLASQATPLNCYQAYDTLGPILTNEANTVMSRLAQMISPYATAANANTMFASMLPAAEGMIMTASASAAEAVRQRMMINLMNDTSKTLAQVLNDPTAAQNAAAAALAAQSANQSYAVLARLAAEMLPMVRNAVELVVIGVFPIVLVLIIMAGAKGGMVLRSYVQVMIWVQLWAPLYAIVNYIGTLASAKRMTSVLGGIDGVTISNAAQLTNTAISSEAIVGMLAISVPLIAMAMVKGGEAAMSGMVSGMMSPGTQAASKMGGAAGVGNISAGNLQWGNISENNVGMNKIDTDTSIRQGAISTRDTSGDITTRFPSGVTTLSQAKHDSLLGGSVAASGAAEAANLASAKVSEAKGDVSAAVTSQNAAFNNMVSQMRQHMLTNTNTTGAQQRESGAFANAFGTDLTGGTSVVGTAGTSQINNGTAQFRVAGGLGGGFERGGGENQKYGDGDKNTGGAPSSTKNQSGRIGASIDAAAMQLQSYQAEIDKALKLNDTTGAMKLANERQSYLNELAQTFGFSKTSTGSTTDGNGVTAQMTEATQHLNQAQASFQRAHELQDSSRILRGASENASYNALSDPRKFSPERLQRITDQLRNASPDARANILEDLARELGGSQMTSQHPRTHISGAPVLATEGQLRDQYQRDQRDPTIAVDVKGKHRENAAHVPSGPVGAGSETDTRGLMPTAAQYTADSRAGADKVAASLAQGHRQDQTRVKAETGFVDSDPKNVRAMDSYNKIGNQAADMADRDLVMSVQQAVPNVLGGKPTLEQHMESLGYDPKNPTSAAIASAPASPDSVRPQAPPGWEGPRIPPKKGK